MVGFSFQLTWVDHPFCSIVSTCFCLRHHLCTDLSFSYHLISWFFSAFFSLYVLELFSLTLLTKFVSSILSRCPSHLSPISPRWFSIPSTPVLSLSKPFGIPSWSVFHTSFESHLISAVWCQPSSLPNNQIHSSSHFLYKIYINDLSASMIELSHIDSTRDNSLNFRQPSRILAVTELWTSPLLPTTSPK